MFVSIKERKKNKRKKIKKKKGYAFFACPLVDLILFISAPDQRSNKKIQRQHLET